MSERGTWTSEFFYCQEWYDAFLEYFSNMESLDGPKYFTCTPHKNGMSIISGRIGGLYAGEEIDSMYEYLSDFLDKNECIGEGVRFSVLAECGQAFFVIRDGEVIVNRVDMS